MFKRLSVYRQKSHRQRQHGQQYDNISGAADRETKSFCAEEITADSEHRRTQKAYKLTPGQAEYDFLLVVPDFHRYIHFNQYDTSL